MTAEPFDPGTVAGPVEWRLDLPWASPPLRDNDRGHWAVKARKVAQVREQAAWLARSQRLPRGLDRVSVTLHWQPASNRRRDVLGPAPTLKPLVSDFLFDRPRGDRLADGPFERLDEPRIATEVYGVRSFVDACREVVGKSKVDMLGHVIHAITGTSNGMTDSVRV